VAAVSHELRTPLATLHATSDVLVAHRTEMTPPAMEAADLVSEDVRALQRLMEELLEVSELDAGRATVRVERVDLRALAEATVRRRHRDVSVDGAPVIVWTDKARLERIVANFVDNAFRHGEGTEVRVTVGTNGELGEISVSDAG